MAEAPAGTGRTGRDIQDWNRGEVVPYWLVVLVLVLLLAVVGVGSYLLYARVVATRGHSATVTEVDRWRSEVAANPSNATSRVALGYALQKECRYEEAVEAYDAALKLDAKLLGALYNRGVCLMELGRDSAAESSLRKVLAIAPEHALAAAALGEYYLSTKQYAKIASAVERAAAANPELSDLHALLGLSYEKAGRTDAAIAEYESALSHAPELKLAQEGLARLKGQD